MRRLSLRAIIANTLVFGSILSTSPALASETKVTGVLFGIEDFPSGIQVDMQLMLPQENSLSEILTEKTRATNVDGGEKPYYCETALLSENSDAHISLTDLSTGNSISEVIVPAFFVQTLRSRTQEISVCRPHAYPTILEGLNLPGLASFGVESASVYIGPIGPVRGIALPSGKFLNYAISGKAAWEQQLQSGTEVQYQSKNFELHSLEFRAALNTEDRGSNFVIPGGRKVPVQYVGKAVSLIP